MTFPAATYGTVLGEYDFSDTSKITASGGAVSAVAQTSGSLGVSLAQGTGANQPITGTRTAPTSGLNVLDFDGTNDQLITGSFSTVTQPVTFAGVCKSDTTSAGTNNRQPVGAGDAITAFYLAASGNWRYFAGTEVDSGDVADTNPHVFVAIFNGASSQLWMDGVQIATGNPGTGAVAALSVGNNASINCPWDGWIGHAIYYSGVVANPAGLSSALNTYWFTSGVVAPPLVVQADDRLELSRSNVYASQQFLTALNRDHTVVSSAYSIQGSKETEIDILSGKVVYDSQDATHSSLDLEIVDPQNRVFDEMSRVVDPFVTVFRVHRGIKYADGTTEEILLGHYYADSVKLSGEASGYPVWQIRAFDASILCQDDLEVPMAISPRPGFEAIQAIIKRKIPHAQFRLPRTAWNIGPLIVKPDQDPWAECRRIAFSLGHNLVWERDDVLTARAPALRTDDKPVWHFIEGRNSTFWDPERDTGSKAFPNVVIVNGTNPGVAGVTGVAQDNDPLSKTFVGRFRRVKTVQSEYPVTSPQAAAMARLILANELGGQDEVRLTAVPNPALADGDTVMATSTKIGLDHTLLIVRHIELPLHVDDAMTVVLGRGVITDSSGAPARAFP